eukprot:TRINITY_DN7453_c0_g1_i2.p1 TRINITY_DN7453_c0_g1~~TRINITY_DN7453_c0_g1_i2.p1  ORF type:complete len:898 (-),score=135.05 TRINITY_DN7453_c0_g1_i2:96-2789(-)
MLEKSKIAMEKMATKALDTFFSPNASGNSSNETVVAEFEGGTLTARRLDSSSLSATGKISVGASDDPGAPAVEVPKELLEELGDVVLVMTVFNGTEPGSTSEDGAQTMSAPVSVELFSKDGQFKGPFPANLAIKMPAPARNATEQNDESSCAYWDEVELRWLTEGLKTVRRDGGIFCETEHLTLFAMVLIPFEELVKAVTCSNVGVLSPDKMANIFKGTWYRRAPAIVMYCAIGVFVALLSYAGMLDYNSRKQNRFKEDCFLVEGDEAAACWLIEIWRDIIQTLVLDTIGVIKNADKVKFLVAAKEAEDDEEEEEDEDDNDAELQGDTQTLEESQTDSCLDAVVNDAKVRSKDEMFLEEPEQEPEGIDSKEVSGPKAEETIVGTCFRARCSAWFHKRLLDIVRFGAVSILSVQASVQKDDLRHHIHLSKNCNGKSDDEDKEYKADVMNQISPYILKQTYSVHATTFGLGIERFSYFRCMWALLSSQNPVHGTLRYSVFISASMQAALLAASIFGPGFLAALFFSASGAVLSIDSPEACSLEQGSAREIFRNIFVGLISWLLTTLPLLLLAYVVKKSFVRRKGWDEKAKARFLLYWNLRNSVVYCGLVLYCIFCVIFIFSFLANVDPRDEYKWLVAASTVIVEDFVVQPLIVTLVIGVTLIGVRCCSPHLIEKIAHEFKISDNSHLVSVSFVLDIVGLQPRQLKRHVRLLSRVKQVIESTVLAAVADPNVPRELVVVHLFANPEQQDRVYANVAVMMHADSTKAEFIREKLVGHSLLLSELSRAVKNILGNLVSDNEVTVDYLIPPCRKSALVTANSDCGLRDECVDAENDRAVENIVQSLEHLNTSGLLDGQNGRFSEFGVWEPYMDNVAFEENVVVLEFTPGDVSGGCQACHACVV